MSFDERASSLSASSVILNIFVSALANCASSFGAGFAVVVLEPVDASTGPVTSCNPEGREENSFFIAMGTLRGKEEEEGTEETTTTTKVSENKFLFLNF